MTTVYQVFTIKNPRPQPRQVEAFAPSVLPSNIHTIYWTTENNRIDILRNTPPEWKPVATFANTDICKFVTDVMNDAYSETFQRYLNPTYRSWDGSLVNAKRPVESSKIEALQEQFESTPVAASDGETLELAVHGTPEVLYTFDYKDQRDFVETLCCIVAVGSGQISYFPTPAEAYANLLMQHRFDPAMQNFPEGFMQNAELGIKFKTVADVVQSVKRLQKRHADVKAIFDSFDLPEEVKQEREIQSEFLNFQNKFILPQTQGVTL